MSRRVGVVLLGTLAAASLTWALWPTKTHVPKRGVTQPLQIHERTFEPASPSLLPKPNSFKKKSPLQSYHALSSQPLDFSEVRCILPANHVQEQPFTFMFGVPEKNCMSFQEILDYAKQNPFDREAIRLMIELLPELENDFLPLEIRACDAKGDSGMCLGALRKWREEVLFDSGLLEVIFRSVHGDAGLSSVLDQSLTGSIELRDTIFRYFSQTLPAHDSNPAIRNLAATRMYGLGLINDGELESMLQGGGCAVLNIISRHPVLGRSFRFGPNELNNRCLVP